MAIFVTFGEEWDNYYSWQGYTLYHTVWSIPYTVGPTVQQKVLVIRKLYICETVWALISAISDVVSIDYFEVETPVDADKIKISGAVTFPEVFMFYSDTVK